MAVTPDLGKFIPVRTEDLVDVLCEEQTLSAEDREKFRRVAELVEASRVAIEAVQQVEQGSC